MCFLLWQIFFSRRNARKSLEWWTSPSFIFVSDRDTNLQCIWINHDTEIHLHNIDWVSSSLDSKLKFDWNAMALFSHKVESWRNVLWNFPVDLLLSISTTQRKTQSEQLIWKLMMMDMEFYWIPFAVCEEDFDLNVSSVRVEDGG